VNFKLFKKESSQLKQKQNESEKKLRSYAFLPVNELYTAVSSASSGITAEQAAKLQNEHGKNIITTGKSNTVWSRLRDALVNAFNLVLIVIAVITLFTDVIDSQTPDYTTIIIIVSLIALSSLVAFVQSQRSNSAAEKLSKMISNKADVLRDGKDLEVSMDEIVPGDIVKLSSGDMIPADIRFLTAKDAFVAQAALTGESNPVEKYSEIQNAPEDALTDLSNIGFMGTNIISGSATAIVLATGNDTFIGSMAKSISGKREKTSFERGVDSVSKLLIRIMLIMVPVILLINGVTKGDWGNALLFSVTIAVGLTPEMLPVIMTSTLAKGAVAMSKNKVIVKTLGSIQAFGEMDILCTDKTGTLTEDKIILEKYINVLGEDDSQVLRYAYFNSHFQTGLKNLMDLAIINRAVDSGLEDALSEYERIDEIPFDFTRRRMSVVLSDKDSKSQLITKGAVEEILSICSSLEWQGEVRPLTDDMREKAAKTAELQNAEGLRMIAVARKNEVPGIGEFDVKDEQEMILIGFVGFLDPPKESAKEAIAALRDYGVRTVVLTGDSQGVAVKVCSKVGIDTKHSLSGKDVENMDDAALAEAIKTCNVFAKLSPSQKERLVKAFRAGGHTVGYMGDGINDAPPLHAADVGISVDSAVDIAKETADIILLKKDLMVLREGVIGGRRTFGNIVKYIKMAASGNFGNMFSMTIASIFLPFLPMLPLQILAQNMLCDFSQMGIPFDRVDKEYLEKPRKWETKSVRSFLLYMGPLSSIFDVLCFVVMWFIIDANTKELAPLFQGGWFVFGTVSQILVIHMIRTGKIPFIQSAPAFPLLISTLAVAVVAVVIGFSTLATGLSMTALPLSFVPWLAALLVGYCLSTQLFKAIYVRRYGEWL